MSTFEETYSPVSRTGARWSPEDEQQRRALLARLCAVHVFHPTNVPGVRARDCLRLIRRDADIIALDDEFLVETLRAMSFRKPGGGHCPTRGSYDEAATRSTPRVWREHCSHYGRSCSSFPQGIRANLGVIAMTNLLDESERAEIETAAQEGGLHESAPNLDALFAKFPPAVRQQRVHKTHPMLQLREDLAVLASLTRTAEHDDALAQWLEEAGRLSAIAGRARFHAILMRRYGRGAQPLVGIDPGISLPQRVVFADKTVHYHFLTRGHKAGAAVACIAVPVFQGTEKQGSSESYGTAWLVTPTHVITCVHVIQARASGEKKPTAQELELQANAARVHFEWSSTTLHDAGIAVKSFVGMNETLDVAVLELATSPPNVTPLVCNAGEISKPKDEFSSVVNIIQHPRGGEKRVGLRANAILEVTATELLYFTDTDEGSSGAPVMDDNWSVVAVHKAAIFRNRLNYMGKIIGYANGGSRITAVLEWLREKLPEVYAQITIEKGV